MPPSAARHRALRPPSGSHVAATAVGSVATLELMTLLAALLTVAALLAAAAAVARTESVLPSGGLPDGEFGNRTRGRLLAFLARQRRADQRPMHGTFVVVARVTRRAARLLDVVSDHRHDGVIRHASLARTVVVQNVTEPRLPLLHQISRRDRWRGKGLRKAEVILAELARTVQPASNLLQP